MHKLKVVASAISLFAASLTSVFAQEQVKLVLDYANRRRLFWLRTAVISQGLASM